MNRWKCPICRSIYYTTRFPRDCFKHPTPIKCNLLNDLTDETKVGKTQLRLDHPKQQTKVQNAATSNQADQPDDHTEPDPDFSVG